MRRRIAKVLLASGLACSPVASEPSSAPAPSPIVESPAPIVEKIALVEPEPEPEPELEPRVQPEPEPELTKPWAPEDERRILAVQPFVAEAAAEHEVDPQLVNGLIWVESNFRPKAKNRSGARGLMQLMPTTAKALGRALHRPAKVYDAEFNVHAGTFYLSRQLRRFSGDERLALAAYARGPGKVRGWLENDEPLPASVEGFVAKVQHARAVFEAIGWPEPETPEAPDDGEGSADAAAAPGP